MQELIGQPDRLRRTEWVSKERRCDATFAYQQIMVDVRREVRDSTSRYVLLKTIVIMEGSGSLYFLSL